MSSHLASLGLKVGKSALLQGLLHTACIQLGAHTQLHLTPESHQSLIRRGSATPSLEQGTGVTSLSASNLGTGYYHVVTNPCKTGSGGKRTGRAADLTEQQSHFAAIRPKQGSGLGKDLCSPTRPGCLLPPARIAITYRPRHGLPCTMLCPKKNQHILTRGSVTHR